MKKILLILLVLLSTGMYAESNIDKITEILKSKTESGVMFRQEVTKDFEFAIWMHAEEIETISKQEIEKGYYLMDVTYIILDISLKYAISVPRTIQLLQRSITLGVMDNYLTQPETVWLSDPSADIPNRLHLMFKLK